MTSYILADKFSDLIMIAHSDCFPSPTWISFEFQGHKLKFESDNDIRPILKFINEFEYIGTL